jgi:hypothetical protein
LGFYFIKKIPNVNENGRSRFNHFFEVANHVLAVSSGKMTLMLVSQRLPAPAREKCHYANGRGRVGHINCPSHTFTNANRFATRKFYRLVRLPLP